MHRSRSIVGFRPSLISLLIGWALVAVTQAAAQAPLPDSPAIEAQARSLVARLSLEQKIELLGGVHDMFTRPMAAIGLPSLKMSDASVGVRNWGPSTAYAGGVSLAATWDPAYARRLGEALGLDARARNVNFLLGPGVNIARSPVAGRNFEYLSEDPFLNSALVVPYIEGVQSEGVIATVKHYALNNQEYDRHNVSSDADERTLREIYLPAFEAAVTQAHVDAVMSAYNLVDGVHATQSGALNLRLLKGEWAFRGILMSDWDATYDSVGACNNGLDLEMPSPRFMNAPALAPAVSDGRVKESTIDDKVMRLLRTALRYGFLHRPPFDPEVSTYSVADRSIALEGARESLTLLRNEGHLLPLDATKIRTLAIIGPNAYPAVTGGGGSAWTRPFEPVSTLAAIANLVGPSVHVLYDPGLPTMREVFGDTRWDGGITVQTYSGKDFTGTPTTTVLSRIDNPDQPGPLSVDATPRSIRYTANYRAGKSGRYVLLATASEQDGDSFHVQVDGRLLTTPPHAEGQIPPSWLLDLTAGQTIHVVGEYLPRFVGVRAGLGIAYEADLVSENARRFAAAADAVVVAVGFTLDTEGEGKDRTFGLPWGQDALIEAAAAANPRIIVTLSGGVGTDTRRWLDKVPALLDVYYPGQEGGTAVAEVLFGRHDPEGRLPVTFDRSWEESASRAYYYPVPGPVTADPFPHVSYGDKLMVGYRYWTTTGKHPLYPFGFGLSYTTFEFSNLRVPAVAASGSTVAVSFDVTNTGAVEGAEVAQVYVSDPSATVSRPERELKGFLKVRLGPRETRRVTLDLDARAFSYWNERVHRWTIDRGRFVVRAGDSSESTPLRAEVTLR
jgi:beta-glucosidase